MKTKVLKTLVLWACLFAVCSSAAEPECFAGGLRLVWYPTFTNKSEGLYFFFEGQMPGIAVVAVEAEADGKRLPAVSGTPDVDTGWLAAPIRNLDTYRMIRLTIQIGRRQWVFEKPRAGQQLILIEEGRGV